MFYKEGHFFKFFSTAHCDLLVVQVLDSDYFIVLAVNCQCDCQNGLLSRQEVIKGGIRLCKCQYSELIANKRCICGVDREQTIVTT